MKWPGPVFVIVALAALALAACGPGPGPTSNQPPQPTATSTSGPSPGVLYYSNDGGGQTHTFYLSAGDYVVNEKADYDPQNDADGAGTCLFGGDLDDETAGWSAAVGNGNLPIQPQVPLQNVFTAHFAAGTYKLEIFIGTTCDWSYEIIPANS